MKRYVALAVLFIGILSSVAVRSQTQTVVSKLVSGSPVLQVSTSTMLTAFVTEWAAGSCTAINFQQINGDWYLVGAGQVGSEFRHMAIRLATDPNGDQVIDRFASYIMCSSFDCTCTLDSYGSCNCSTAGVGSCTKSGGTTRNGPGYLGNFY